MPSVVMLLGPHQSRVYSRLPEVVTTEFSFGVSKPCILCSVACVSPRLRSLPPGSLELGMIRALPSGTFW